LRPKPTFSTKKVVEKTAKINALKSIIPMLIMATLSYIPLLLTKPGVISVDTKQYLYLDPISYLSQVASIWSSKVDLGTVTHQNIGYLMPMGEWYSFFSLFHVPVWIAQRLWAGTVFFVAGAGAYYFSRTLNLSRAGSTAGATVYMLSPYMLQYIEHISALLLPVAALGWMMGFTVMALRTRQNLYSLAFAIAVALSSTINATSFGYVAIGPVIVLIFMLIYSETTLRRAVSVSFQFLILSFLVSFYWIEGLLIESKYGLNVLKLTESLSAISSTSTPAEIFRGIGYWYFYSSDSYGFVIPTSIQYQTWTWLIVISFLIPIIALISIGFIKWKYKSLNVSLIIVGFVLSVGIYPISHPSWFGSKLLNFMNGSEIGLALRSSTRATPLYVIGIAVLIGSLVSAFNFRFNYIEKFVALIIILLAIYNLPGLFDGNTVNLNMARESIPTYWHQAANYLSSKSNNTRVLQEPGQNFDSYTFGATNDSLLAGLTTRPTVERHQVAMGSTYGVNLLDQLDNSIQRSDLNPAGLSAVLRLMSAGDMLITNDEMYSRYQIPPPANIQEQLTPTPIGLGTPKSFGKPTYNFPPLGLPYYNNQILSLNDKSQKLPPLIDYSVKNTRPIVRLESTKAPVIIDGDGLGVIEAANSGLLNGNPTIFYSGSYVNNPKGLKSLLTKNSTLVITDSNRKQLKNWTSLIDQTGSIETASQNSSSNNNNISYFNIFPDTTNKMQTVAVDQGVKSITSSTSKDNFEFNPQSKPFNAFDGNINTSWTTNDFENPIGAWIQVELNSVIKSNRITLTQAIPQSEAIWITKVRITLKSNDKLSRQFTVNLNQQSRRQLGQTIRFPETNFNTVRITILKTYSPLGYTVVPVGFSEINVNNIQAREIIQPPTDLIDELGKQTANYRLVYLFSRSMVGSLSPRTSPESNISRFLDLPTSRNFLISGDATLSTQTSDETVSSLLNGTSLSSNNLPYYNSSSRLSGDDNAYAASVEKSSVNSAWQTSMGLTAQLGSWIQINNPTSVTFNQIVLSFYADGHHSIPTFVTISTQQGQREIQLPPNLPFNSQTKQDTVILQFPALSGRNIRMTIQAVNPVESSFDFGPYYETLPVGINSFNLQNLPNISTISAKLLNGNSASVSQNLIANVPPPVNLPNICRNNLATIDNKPIWLKIMGTSQAALQGKYLKVVGCGPDKNGIYLPAGTHIVETAAGQQSGINIDQLVFDSPITTDIPPPNNADTSGFIKPAPTVIPKAKIKLLNFNDTKVNLRVTTYGKPVWLILGENYNSGWQAKVTSGNSSRSLINSSSTLIDAFANGWLIKPPAGTNNYNIELYYAPQNSIDLALFISFGTLFLCVAGLIFLQYKRRKNKNIKNNSYMYTPTVVQYPAFTNPLKYGLGRGNLIFSIFISIIFFLFVSSVLNQFDAIVMSILLFALTQIRQVRFIVSLGIITLALYATFWIEDLQSLHKYSPGVFWPPMFTKQSHIFYIVVILTIVECLAYFARNRSLKRKKL
jgi:hypothetical protein